MKTHQSSITSVQKHPPSGDYRGLVKVTQNNTKKGVELLFGEELAKALSERLKQYGFKQVFNHPTKWYASQHPAFVQYANTLEKTLRKGDNPLSIPLHPSFTPSEENIDQNKFSYVTLSYKKDGSKKQDHYVVFDSYKAVATVIATRYGKQTYKTDFIGVTVYPRNYKQKARQLLKAGKVIGTIPQSEPKPTENKETPAPIIPKGDNNSSNLLSKTSPPDSYRDGGLQGANISPLGDFRGLFTVEQALEKPYTVIDLQSRWYDAYEHFENTYEKPALEQIEQWKNTLKTLKKTSSSSSSTKSSSFGGQQGAALKEKITAKAEETQTIKNAIEDENITFQQELIQYAIERAKTLGYTVEDEDTITDFSVDLSETLFNERAIERYYNKPIPEIIDQFIHSFFRETSAPVVPKGDNNSNNISSETSPSGGLQGANISPLGDYRGHIDLIVAHLYEKYANGERPTKKQIEDLGTALNVPNSGMLWEATELSWLLWYKQLYNEPLPFEQRLEKMIRFWDKQQPTYTYSDSSKELYKQYSTPCPIAAMVAQYTQMDTATSIFEPSAGNGLLLLGADPKKTHVNEIDPTRLASLRFQGFKKITADNAIQPFPEAMKKAYDVMVTNPPFSRWEEEKFDKDYIIRKYFDSHIGLSGHIRLEHLMAGLALHTLKDDGKAAIIVMGHIHFSPDGLIAKYRSFFNWLYRHYRVDDVINISGFKLYNKQGAVARTMLILINGRKSVAKGVAPTQKQAPYLDDVVESFQQLWERIKPHIGYNINTIINQLQIALAV